ncbi:phage tail protein [Niameybacter massiliensis]|uniref:Phage tail protein n=1 Tax=Holtiella tumoricola TaxID=3018743 RepID=A0AA42DMR8_9FIRM|nr:phage tail protein [Holtiella tumoricola]MDA3731666.1 phage tail protein [Holtiella tumoricola]
MTLIKIDLDKHLVKQAEEMLSEVPNGMKRCMKNAINKTTRSAGRSLHNELKTDYNIKVSEIKRGLNIQRATLSRLEGKVIANGPVTRLKKGFRTDTKTPKAYAAYIKKRSRKSLPEQAFVQTMPNSGHIGIFERTGGKMGSNPKRDEIRELKGPSVAGMANSKNISKEVKKELEVNFDKNFKNEVIKLLNK